MKYALYMSPWFYLQFAFLYSFKYTNTYICECSVAQSCLILCNPFDCSLPGKFSGSNTEIGWHSLLQRIFLTQGLYPQLLCLLNWQVDSLPLAPPGEPTSPWENPQFKKKHTHPNVYSSTVYNSQDKEAAWLSEWIREMWVCIYIHIWWNSNAFWSNIDIPTNYHTKLHKTEKYMILLIYEI